MRTTATCVHDGRWRWLSSGMHGGSLVPSVGSVGGGSVRGWGGGGFVVAAVGMRPLVRRGRAGAKQTRRCDGTGGRSPGQRSPFEDLNSPFWRQLQGYDPLCDIPSGCCSFTGPWTVTRSSLRMLRRVAAFCRPLRPVLLLVSFPRSRSPVVGVLGLCWMWHGVPFACQRRPIIGILRMCWLLPGSFDCFCCPPTTHLMGGSDLAQAQTNRASTGLNAVGHIGITLKAQKWGVTNVPHSPRVNKSGTPATSPPPSEGHAQSERGL